MQEGSNILWLSSTPVNKGKVTTAAKVFMNLKSNRYLSTHSNEIAPTTIKGLKLLISIYAENTLFQQK